MTGEVLDLSSLLAESTGPLWGTATEQLNATFLSWSAGHEIAPHVNNEVDVIMVVLQGEGSLTLDGKTNEMSANFVAVIPKGSERGIIAKSTPFAYLNVHRRRTLQLGEAPPRR